MPCFAENAIESGDSINFNCASGLYIANVPIIPNIAADAPKLANSGNLNNKCNTKLENDPNIPDSVYNVKNGYNPNV